VQHDPAGATTVIELPRERAAFAPRVNQSQRGSPDGPSGDVES
jgi:hypothetical protein